MPSIKTHSLVADYDMKIRLIETIKLLRYIGIKTYGYKITNARNIIGVIVAGLNVIEVLDRKTTDSDFAAFNITEVIKEPVNYDEDLPFFYEGTYARLDVDNLGLIIKYKPVAKMNKVAIAEFRKDYESVGIKLPINIKSSVEIRENILHMQYRKPSTNTLAMADQFKLNHKAIVEKIFQVLESYPILFNEIRWNMFYTIVGDGATQTGLYLEVSEAVYKKFIDKMGTPKSKEMRVYREKKLQEYFEAFKKLNEKGYLREITKEESRIYNMIPFAYISRLLYRINNFADTQIDLYNDEKNRDVLRRVIFLLIHFETGIDITEDVNISPSVKITLMGNYTRVIEMIKLVEPKDTKNLLQVVLVGVNRNFIENNVDYCLNYIKHQFREYELEYLLEILLEV